MANGHSNGTIFGPDMSLTPDQQSLLRTALSSNNPNVIAKNGLPDPIPSLNGVLQHGNTQTVHQNSSPQVASSYQSPTQDTTSPVVDTFPLDDSPFTDGLDYEDGNFDWVHDGDQLFGDLPGGHEDEDTHDKRKNDEDEDGKNKRHEGNDKNSKKPGRKPLNNSEPTTVSLEAELFQRRG